ncbi:MAG TPA: molecular chaperone HtpG [Anaerolineae bacterium]|nr:molecular chaperone HtpG [Anaerolineae bacterium]
MTTMEMEKETTYNFKAEIQQVLNILIHSLYQDSDIFLRELISNASDALTRLQFEMLTNQNVVDPDAELAIHIEVEGEETGEEDEDGDEKVKKLIIKDSGIGMTRDELIRSLGTIAQSGAREFLSTINQNNGEKPNINDVIGQFGVGFYSVFMVADEVRVISRSHHPDAEAAMWISDGKDSFRIEPADKADRGTEIHIYLKEDAYEFASSWKVRQVIKKHSDFVAFPIYLGEEQVNQQQSLWRKAPDAVEQEDYEKFYQQMSLDFEKPLGTVHFHGDVPVNARLLLFIPSKRDRGVLALRKEPGVKLYSNNVLIQEYCNDLLPAWLDFVDGVVDSADLPLNVSRETVQNNRLMRQLAKVVRSRVLRYLRDLGKKEPEKYAQFIKEFGRAFKEGLATDPSSRDDILPYLRFHTSHGDELTSLDEYIERMPEGQTEIYYVLGDSIATVTQSPHLDPFKAKGIEVLYWVDPLDPFITQAQQVNYQDYTFVNVDGANLDDAADDVEDEETDKKDEETTETPEFTQFMDRIATALGDNIVEVRPSKVLSNSPVRLVSPKDQTDTDMQRIQRIIGQNYVIPKKIMEVNRTHPLIVNLTNLTADDTQIEVVNMAIEQLYASALVQEGLHPNPTDMLPRIQKLMELAVGKVADNS